MRICLFIIKQLSGILVQKKEESKKRGNTCVETPAAIDWYVPVWHFHAPETRNYFESTILVQEKKKNTVLQLPP
jgi:hypothetical protein